MIYIAILLISILQFSVMPFIYIGAARINLLLIIMAYIALFKKKRVIPCLVCGVISGALTFNLYNLEWFLFTLLGLGLMMVNDKFYKENILCQIIIMLVVSGIVYTCEYILISRDIHPKIVIYSAIYTAVVSPLLFRTFAASHI